MSWAWLARVTGTPAEIDAVFAGPVPAVGRATLTAPDGEPLGELGGWPAGRKPVRDAVRVAARVLDPHGEPGWISLVLLPPGRAPLFDDPAVSGVLRAVLAGPAPDAVSTFVRDSTHFAGAVTIWRGALTGLGGDPFSRLARPLLARIGPGLFGRVPAPAGPGIQRYAGQPWPAAGF